MRPILVVLACVAMMLVGREMRARDGQSFTFWEGGPFTRWGGDIGPSVFDGTMLSSDTTTSDVIIGTHFPDVFIAAGGPRAHGLISCNSSALPLGAPCQTPSGPHSRGKKEHDDDR